MPALVLLRLALPEVRAQVYLRPEWALQAADELPVAVPQAAPIEDALRERLHAERVALVADAWQEPVAFLRAAQHFLLALALRLEAQVRPCAWQAVPAQVLPHVAH